MCGVAYAPPRSNPARGSVESAGACRWRRRLRWLPRVGSCLRSYSDRYIFVVGLRTRGQELPSGSIAYEVNHRRVKAWRARLPIWPLLEAIGRGLKGLAAPQKSLPITMHRGGDTHVEPESGARKQHGGNPDGGPMVSCQCGDELRRCGELEDPGERNRVN